MGIIKWVSKWKKLIKVLQAIATKKYKIKGKSYAIWMKILITFYFPFFFFYAPVSPFFHSPFISSFSSLNCKVPKFEYMYKKNFLISSWILNLIGFRFFMTLQSRRVKILIFLYRELWKKLREKFYVHTCIIAHF